MEKYHKAPEGKKEEIECNPYTIFHQALENCKPVVGLASIQKGGKFYQVRQISPLLIYSTVLHDCMSSLTVASILRNQAQLLFLYQIKSNCIVLPGAHPSYGEQTALPCHEMDDHRVQGQQTQTYSHVWKTFPGAVGSIHQGGQCYQEEIWAAQDGWSQQSLRPLPLVVERLKTFNVSSGWQTLDKWRVGHKELGRFSHTSVAELAVVNKFDERTTLWKV